MGKGTAWQPNVPEQAKVSLKMAHVPTTKVNIREWTGEKKSEKRLFKSNR